MPRMLIENCHVWQEDDFVVGSTLILRDGLIAGLAREAEVRHEPGDCRLDGRGAFALPGFVDVHAHGSVGFDVMEGSRTTLRNLSDFLVRQGVTGFLGTTMTDSGGAN